jgi:hypothetical protein
MSWNIQPFNKQNVNSVQYSISRERPTNKDWGNLEMGIFMKAKKVFLAHFAQIGRN